MREEKPKTGLPALSLAARTLRRVLDKLEPPGPATAPEGARRVEYAACEETAALVRRVRGHR